MWFRFGRRKRTTRTQRTYFPLRNVCVLLYPVATHVNVAVLASNWTRRVFGGAVGKILSICGTPEWSRTLGNVIGACANNLVSGQWEVK